MDEKYMKIALELAQKGRGKVSPNPMVGAVIVKKGKIIGQGYHEKCGEAHAEVNAFNNATEDVTGATIYVTLEPCSHYGKTPPCVNKIIEKKISKVVVGSVDPNPLVAGKGVCKLRENGIEVITGIMDEECKKVNEVFMKYIVTKRPFIILKSAMTLDGKIATVIGDSKWITNEESRKLVHELRNEVTGIMVGVNTVITDDPQLTCRIENGKNPIRIVVDSKLRTPLSAKIFDGDCSEVIIATTKNGDKEKKDKLESLGVKVLTINSKDEKVDLQHLTEVLGELKIDSVLIEGGSILNYSALEQNIVDKVQVYIAPKLIGGENSKTPIGGKGIELLKDAINVKELTYRNIGNDILLEGYL